MSCNYYYQCNCEVFYDYFPGSYFLHFGDKETKNAQ
jgi:hypothetical protein